jgi:hypothetical protein
MDALRKSLNDVGKGRASQPAKDRKPKKAASGQREMLMAISGKGEARPRAPPRKQSGRHVSARRMKSGDLGIDGLVPELGTLRGDPELFCAGSVSTASASQSDQLRGKVGWAKDAVRRFKGHRCPIDTAGP